MQLLFAVLVSFSAAWVYWDASGHGIGKAGGSQSFWNLSAGAWGFAVLLLWVVAFPGYLVKRRELIEKARAEGQVSTARPLKAGLFALPGALSLVGALAPTNLPACDDPGMLQLATKVLRDNGGQGELSEVAQVDAETTNARRMCRTQLTLSGEPSLWVKYAIEPHKDGVFLQFQP